MKSYVHEKNKPSRLSIDNLTYDVVVVGGGLSGLIAAIASSRTGAKTALFQDRSVLGGNSSSEIRMHICGASCHWGKKDALETGILMELLLENKRINNSYNYSVWDGVLWSKAKEEKNLDLFLNTTMIGVEASDGHINSIRCYQMTTESNYVVSAKIYIDATGLGTLSSYAGAECRIGTEGTKEYGESNAPDLENGDTMGNTIMFSAYDTGKPVKFKKPSWAYTFTEEDFAHRYHGDITVYHNANDVVILKDDEDFDAANGELVEKYDVQSGYWWIELGGDFNNIIKDAEDIRYELYKTVYGIWDHIKNGGDHGADNYELLWIGNMPGIRESRRIIGEYVLTEKDIYSNRIFNDEVAYGGWPMDEHTAGGFRAKGEIPSKVRSFNGLYSIPYGCYVSKDVDNLMVCGKIISASKQAMGSTRIMGTCSVGGQAVGTAAALAAKKGINPSDYGKKYITELQQQLLKDDCYLIGKINEDRSDKVRSATVTATSYIDNCFAENIKNGISRNTEGKYNLWMAPKGSSLTITFEKSEVINEIRLTFDPNLNQEKTISIAKSFISKEIVGVPPELVKNYRINLIKDGELLITKEIKDNYQRLNVIPIESICVDQIVIDNFETNGDEYIKVFEVRAY